MGSRLVRSFLLPLFVFPLSAYGQASNLFFQPPSFPGQIAVDLNGDGKLDSVRADGLVYLGNGDGTFTKGQSLGIPASDSFDSILAADLNGDGKIDLVFVPCSNCSPVLLIFLGNGDGTFRPAMNLNPGTSLGSVALGDFNSDGKPDLVGTYTGGIFLFLGKGDGTFAGGINISTSSVRALTVGDLDGDGKLDIAFGDATGNLNVLLGNGNGTFGAPIVSAGIGAAAMVIADFNNDGKPDLALASSSQTAILLGNGDGTFQTPKPVPASAVSYVSGIAAVDLNGDGKVDLVLRDTGVGTGTVFLGQGDGTFVAKGTYFGGGAIIADFNGDGKPDIAGDQILTGNGDGTFQGYLLTPVVGNLNIAGDFNQDGFADIASATGSVISIAFSNGAVHPNGPISFSQGPTYSVPGEIAAMATADLNGDGKLDLVVVSLDSSSNQNWSLNVLLNNSGGNFAAPITIPEGVPLSGGGATPPQLVVADFNGDRVPDVAVLNTANPGLQILLGKGDGTFGPPSSPIFVGSSPNSFVVADFNGDGKLDVAAEGDAGLGILLGKGDGTFQPATFPNATVQQVIDTADFNVDGKMDLLVGEGVLLGNGDGTFELALPIGGQPTGILRAVDVNRDGIPDVLEVLGLEVLLGNGDGTFQNPIIVIGGICCSSHVRNPLVAIGDFNGDGRPDALIQFSDDLGSVEFAVLNTSAPPPPDFLFRISPVAPAAVTPGKSGSATVTLTPIGGFTGSVMLSCSNLPTGVNCSFAPSSLNGSGSSTLTISTTAPSQGFVLPSIGDLRTLNQRPWLYLSLVSMAIVIGLAFLDRRNKNRWIAVFSLMVLAAGCLLATSCGGGSSSGGPGSPGTQPGTYTITVSGSSSSGSSTVTHTANVVLVVQ